MEIIVVDSYSLTPKECYLIYQKAQKGKVQIILTQYHMEIFERKIKAYQEGKEFLPEYYEFANQIENVSLDDFRNGGVIQKSFGFRDQRGEKVIDYIKKNGKYIKDL
ncbi:MAG: hypothetical protein ACTSR2_01090 [Candidatus Hodarchaeales archaeon]